MSFRIREARPADAVAIGRIHVETWQATYAGVLPAAWLAALNPVRRGAQWTHEMRRPANGDRIFVAEDDVAGVIGFGTCGRARRVPPGWAPTGAAVGEVYMLYVEPDRQDQGIGRALLEAMFAQLGDAGCSRVMLWALAGNPNRFFYEAMDGTRIAAQSGRFAGQAIEEVAYGWADVTVLAPVRRR